MKTIITTPNMNTVIAKMNTIIAKHNMNTKIIKMAQPYNYTETQEAVKNCLPKGVIAKVQDC